MSMFSTKGGLYERARKKFKITDGIKLFSYPFYKQRRVDVQVCGAGSPPQKRSLLAISDPVSDAWGCSRLKDPRGSPFVGSSSTLGTTRLVHSNLAGLFCTNLL
jgi:hypothetical protein